MKSESPAECPREYAGYSSQLIFFNGFNVDDNPTIDWLEAKEKYGIKLKKTPIETEENFFNNGLKKGFVILPVWKMETEKGIEYDTGYDKVIPKDSELCGLIVKDIGIDDPEVTRKLLAYEVKEFNNWLLNEAITLDVYNKEGEQLCDGVSCCCYPADTLSQKMTIIKEWVYLPNDLPHIAHMGEYTPEEIPHRIAEHQYWNFRNNEKHALYYNPENNAYFSIQPATHLTKPNNNDFDVVCYNASGEVITGGGILAEEYTCVEHIVMFCATHAFNNPLNTVADITTKDIILHGDKDEVIINGILEHQRSFNKEISLKEQIHNASLSKTEPVIDDNKSKEQVI